MSQVDEAKDLLVGVKSNFEDLKTRVEKMESSEVAGVVAEQKEAIEKISASMNEQEGTIDKLVKSIEADKAKTKMVNEIDSDSQKRKESAEFLKGLRALAKGEKPAFNTNEFKSVVELKDYNSGSDSAGGAAVIPFIDSQIDKLIREYSDVRSLATTATISTDKWEQLKMNQVNGAKWAKDMADFTSSTKDNTLNKLSIIVEDLYGIAIFQDNLVNDAAFDLVGAVLTSLAEDMAIEEAASFWSGDGVGEMDGILNAPVVGSGKNGFDEIERVATASSTSVVLEDIFDLIGALKAPYQNGAQFKANRLGITELRKLRSDSGAGAGTGQFLWQPSNIVGVPATLAGFPISQAQELASDITAANAEGVVFGNFSSAYRIVDRMGMEVLRDNLTQWPNIAYKAKKRVGGGVQKGEALKILKTQA
jgi:HK97 family phage major capsid protein